MKVAIEDQVESMIQPLVTEANVRIYDIEFASGVLRVTLDRDGGIDVDTIGEFSRSISQLLDEDEDMIPGDQYMLEVTSPGIERKLRKPVHFQAMVGEKAKLKLRHGSGAARRVEGVIGAADDESITVTTTDGSDETRKLDYDEIESARSVFDFTAALESAKKSANDDPVNDDDEKATAR